MLIVDAGTLFEVLASTPRAARIRPILAVDPDRAAPQLIDAEVMSVIVRQHRRQLLDPTSAGQAVDDLRTWPGERWPLTVFSDRVWELRDTVRSYDAYCVALAEELDAALVTCDRRLARAAGPTCEIVVPPD